MNKGQALYILNNLVIRINLYGVSELSQYESNEVYDALNVFNELIDKATPFKPLNQEIEGVNFVLYGQCKCGCEVWEGWKFCVDCGQAIDWSKE